MKSVCIIMSTYNGEKFIRKQLDSIFNQTYTNIVVFVRDDGSSDETIDILEEYHVNKGLIYNKGRNIGAKKSFMEAIFMAPAADYYALADQDDIWYPKKVEAAIKKIQIFDGKPSLYHSTINLIDEKEQNIGKRGTYIKKSFLEGETRPVVGCTVVFNDSLMKLIKRHIPIAFPMHDAWIHRLCQAVDGEIIYDEESYIGYRQHSSNEVGAKKGIINALKRRIHYYKKLPKNMQSNMIRELLNVYCNEMSTANIEKATILCEYQQSIKKKIEVLLFRPYFRGRFWWRIEQSILVLINRY